MNILPLILVAMGLTGVLALIWFAFTGPSPAKESTRRLRAVRYRHSNSTTDRVEAQMRRAVAARKPKLHQIAGSGSRIDALALRLHRTGKPWTVSQYFYVSLGLAAAVAAIIFLKSGAPALSLVVGLLVGAGLPHMVVNNFIKRRSNAFTVKFADAIDLLVRGLRSGLPVTETLGVVASEVPGPVGEEFKLVTERIKIGKTMEDALQETADRLAMPEFNFFCITLAIQRETGGNLAETLANLGDVLRKRAQMKLKIRAMSSESKASAYIVGALPFIVFGLIWWINPGYIGEFFIDERLIVAGLGGMVWMGIGAFIMAKMVSFEI
ncbi:type II secretion system F family protein [Novosphingobium mangrovi (ex Huang et al. 2023)]|uniref:Type II secretion system F family protein n=1 Tax=Novosphingobium mangrovi (ex Huang et al. 2023) TaxID=2976432 RepID=A0ABT2I4D0_9SPHN|nr:type II secretion system F family protein [Novosphingobium mangrovi (ex Huang et al. 2023)]MCT2399662.1 type II secretion system F family protein [Novosphingobium mangrovi (ex Huang et al. 2023)]